MKIKDYVCKCGHKEFTMNRKGNHTGIYCCYCGKWLKWASKDEVNLFRNYLSEITGMTSKED